MADPNRDISTDADEDGVDTAALLRRLARVVVILQKTSTRMDAISAGWSVPGPPDQPAALASLNSIVTTAQHSIDIANRLIGTISPTH